MCYIHKYTVKVLSLLSFLFVSTSFFYGFLYITVCYQGCGKLEEKVNTKPGPETNHSTYTSL
jgi:hypothetical protein